MKIIMGEPYEFQNADQTLEMPDGYIVRQGAHKHGYYISLTAREQGLLIRGGYKLITNLFYSPGDFYEILDNPWGVQSAKRQF